jgi:hypothetical protein
VVRRVVEPVGARRRERRHGRALPHTNREGTSVNCTGYC